MRLESSFKKILLASSVSFLLAGCGSTALESEEQELVQSQEERLGLTAACEEEPELIEHACFHSEFGPFVAVSAAPLGSTAIPNVNAPHTAFNITLPAGTSCNYAGSVTFRPVESGEYAFFLSRYRGLKIYDGTTLIASECSSIIGEETCGTLRRQVLADLEEGKAYRLEFQAVRARNASFTLVIEEAGHHDHEE